MLKLKDLKARLQHKYNSLSDRLLLKVGMQRTSVALNQVALLKAEHERHKENLRMQIECAHKDGLEYIVANSRIRVRKREENKCECKTFGFTVYMDESVMWGLRPSDRKQTEWLRHILSMHIAQMIEHGMYTREPY